MKTTKAHCNQCLDSRQHDVLHSHSEKWNSNDGGICGSDEYDLLRCRGCESIAVRHIAWCSEDIDELGAPYSTVLYYPPSISRPMPRWVHDLVTSEATSLMGDLLQEIYVGLQNNIASLATMGIRALIESIMIEKIDDQGSFAENINAFMAAGHISKDQEGILKAALEVGHAVIHRSYSPSKDDLETCMDIVEGIVETLYIHPHKADKLSQKVPRRK